MLTERSKVPSEQKKLFFSRQKSRRCALGGGARPFYACHAFYAYQRTHALLCLSGLFMLISGRVAPIHVYQCVKKKWNRLISKRLFFQERSVQFEFSLPPKSQMVSFRLISLICGRPAGGQFNKKIKKSLSRKWPRSGDIIRLPQVCDLGPNDFFFSSLSPTTSQRTSWAFLAGKISKICSQRHHQSENPDALKWFGS